MLECGLRAVVLHNKEVVWNYYAEFTADCRRINTNKLSTSGGVMTGNIEMTSNILSFNGDYKIYNTGGRLSIDSADGSAICFLEGNRLWLNCAGFYAFYAQVSQDGRLIFYNHDHTPVMSIAYNGGIKVKGSIEQNATF